MPEAQGNFVWLRLGDAATEFAAVCDPVSVGPFARGGVRISIGEPAVNVEFEPCGGRGGRTTIDQLSV